ncbi:MAG: HAMP domain-containing protein [Chloroflexi bacterium]|nr:HAMP domain-containing protein [Chloroflexota bacterium]
MLYVTVGLALMLGSGAVVGLGSVEEATQLIYRERLSTAYITAGILERDFLHVARDAEEVSLDLLRGEAADPATAARAMLKHLSQTDPFPFFQVTGVWVLDGQSGAVATAGSPQTTRGSSTPLLSPAAKLPRGGFAVLSAPAMGAEGVPFATILTRVEEPARSTSLVVAVHTISVNSPLPYSPTSYWRGGLAEALPPTSSEDPSEAKYHLEVVRPDGVTVLGIGEDEQPGQVSRHWASLRSIVAQGKASALLHQPASGDSFEAHVMAVVPLQQSDFHVVLEQPVDVALVLPTQIRQRLVFLTTLGFLASLLVAWLTTRHVVKPTEQLTAAARGIAEGKVETPITVVAEDEIGILAESLEIMRQRLQTWGAELEKEVQTRTAELEARNQELRELYRTLQQKEEQLRSLLGKVLVAQEDERRRISYELHDEIGQGLTAMRLEMERLARSSADAGVRERSILVQEMVSGAVDDLRRIIAALHPGVLDQLGLVPALQWVADRTLHPAGIEFSMESDEGPRLASETELVLFRIAQEALHNVARHSGARHVVIRLTRLRSEVVLTVQDNGGGFDAAAIVPDTESGRGLGLAGMRERASLLGGNIRIESGLEWGTIVEVAVPLTQVATGEARIAPSPASEV